MIDAETLRRFNFFAAFPDGPLERLAGQMPQISPPANTVVFAMGDSSASMYLILDGRVMIQRTDDAGELVDLGSLGPNQTFGELALFSREPRQATVTTVSECRFMVLERPVLLELIRQAQPEAILELFAVLSQQIRAANEGDFQKLLARRTLESQMEVEKQRGLT